MRCPGHLGSHPQEGSRRSLSCDQEVPRRPQKAPRRLKGCPRTPQGDQTPPGPPRSLNQRDAIYLARYGPRIH